MYIQCVYIHTYLHKYARADGEKHEKSIKKPYAWLRATEMNSTNTVLEPCGEVHETQAPLSPNRRRLDS